MKKAIRENLLRHTGITLHRMLAGVLLGAMPMIVSKVVGADQSFQHNVLFNPSKEQLMAESRGRIMIYDGLDNEVVNRALDEQFGRIEHMMFVRIQHAQPDDEVIIEDDGC